MKSIFKFLTVDGFMYKSKIIGLIFLKDTNSAFPLYVANDSLACSGCGEAILQNDTFTRDTNYRRVICKVCRPLVGERYFKQCAQTMQAFRVAVEMKRMHTIPAVSTSNVVSECKAIMRAAGYEISAKLLTESNAEKMLSPIRIVYFRLCAMKSMQANRLRTLANTFLPEKI